MKFEKKEPESLRHTEDFETRHVLRPCHPCCPFHCPSLLVRVVAVVVHHSGPVVIVLVVCLKSK
jgi:hypothetical protein